MECMTSDRSEAGYMVRCGFTTPSRRADASMGATRGNKHIIYVTTWYQLDAVSVRQTVSTNLNNLLCHLSASIWINTVHPT